jgi:hypothetical protein
MMTSFVVCASRSLNSWELMAVDEVASAGGRQVHATTTPRFKTVRRN